MIVSVAAKLGESAEEQSRCNRGAIPTHKTPPSLVLLRLLLARLNL